MVALAGARGVDKRGAVRRQRRGREDKNHEEEADELFHISITADFYYSKKAGKAQHKAMQRAAPNGAERGGETMEKVKELLMQQMELLHERAKKAESADDLAALTRGMIGLSEEMRDIRCGIGTRLSVTTARVDAKGANGEPLIL